ncbi:MAG TPA: sulfite exporter TauE/SafE family protein [Acidobacteriota bacterium]|nr:sulfite exporter TauE/SafE family protein [Acidobacteriota bacterium]HQM62875.1 sulfite exporter TauE/SafE family protein [Acidobacteriota bacterium]
MELCWRGALLGLTNGAICLAACVPVLLPYLVGEGERLKRNAVVLAGFLGGRLVGYLAFGLLAWLFGLALPAALPGRLRWAGAIYLVLGLLLAVYGFRPPRTEPCLLPAAEGPARRLAERRPALLPPLLGLLTGLNLCPPFLLAFTEAAGAGTLSGSLLFFLTFYAATSLFFVPLPLLGTLGRFPAVRTVGRLAAGVVGVYYVYRGLTMLS